ncbi:MAG TPA: NrsF family protein [Kofleriaceae bacterium]|nr:NrsF family protein [Kofleriaceae bacterium]
MSAPVDPLDQKVEASLGALGAAGEDAAPALSPELERELGALPPVKTRAPRRQLAGILALSLLYATGVVALAGLRRDLGGLPLWHLVGFAALWLVSFASVSWLVIVPARGQMMPRARIAAVVAAAAAAILIAVGLFLPRSVPGLSTVYTPTISAVVERAGCIRWGLLGAALPILLAALAVRGSVPVASRFAAAALGAAGGALGGLVLQFHCPITERFHVGFVHGGLVIVTSLVAVLAAQAQARTPGPSGDPGQG